jgi:hypothetical protein
MTLAIGMAHASLKLTPLMVHVQVLLPWRLRSLESSIGPRSEKRKRPTSGKHIIWILFGDKPECGLNILDFHLPIFFKKTVTAPSGARGEVLSLLSRKGKGLKARGFFSPVGVVT